MPPTVLLPSPAVLAPLPAIPQQSTSPIHGATPTAPSPSLQPPSAEIQQSSAPPIAVLSAQGGSAGSQPAGAPGALPAIISPDEAGQPPSAVIPMDDVQAPPHITATEVADATSTVAFTPAEQEQHAVVPVSAADIEVEVVETKGVAEPSTPLALPVPLPTPSTE
ncbi:hypothetical protein PAXRUDRAFT_17961 [Paxillus rubicundulus Ve08.2h10]|uniref:Uncharacterized protein n=1 Tax=Paxillus rubicundulus Ve08.2h10 TaxID=930991 RepID=A0A0D0CNA2_9AGAM|nr:hypothetical protein PAXRUDRAFT_17961 [Paxillus rubicundulus Ve08.2h10]